MSAQAHADHGAPESFVRRWLYSTNHKDIGTMYIVFAILAAFIGGGLSVYMRMELMEPGVQYMADGHVWNVFTTAHGLIMVFFVVMPGLIGGFGNWFVPIMIGAPDMAFPRTNNISFWLLPLIILLLLSAVMDGGAGGMDDLSAAVIIRHTRHVHGSCDLLAAPCRCVLDPCGPISSRRFSTCVPPHDTAQDAAFAWAMLITPSCCC